MPEVLESDDIEYKLQIIRWAYDNTLYPRMGKLYFRDFASSLMKYLIETVGEKFSL